MIRMTATTSGRRDHCSVSFIHLGYRVWPWSSGLPLPLRTTMNVHDTTNGITPTPCNTTIVVAVPLLGTLTARYSAFPTIRTAAYQCQLNTIWNMPPYLLIDTVFMKFQYPLRRHLKIFLCRFLCDQYRQVCTERKK